MVLRRDGEIVRESIIPKVALKIVGHFGTFVLKCDTHNHWREYLSGRRSIDGLCNCKEPRP